METKTKNIIVSIVGIIIALVLIAGLALGIFAGIKKHQETETEDDTTEIEQTTADIVNFEFSEMASKEGIIPHFGHILSGKSKPEPTEPSVKNSLNWHLGHQ